MSIQTESRGRPVGPVGAARQRPLLFLILVLGLLSGSFVAAEALMRLIPAADVHLRTDIVALDLDAATPSSLIQVAEVDPDSLRRSISDAVSQGDGALDERFDVDDLIITRGDDGNEFILSAEGDDGPPRHADVDAITSTIVDALNRQKIALRDRALTWIDETEAVWQNRIDEAKAAIVESPFNPDPPGSNGRRSEEELLRMMIAATVGAQTADAGEQEMELAPDLARLRGALDDVEAGHAAQFKHGSALRDSEAGLARHRKEARVLLADGGVFDRPAAEIIEPPASREGEFISLLQRIDWPTLFPAMVVLSLVVASIVTIIVCRLRPEEEMAAGDYLNNPNWPLPPNARRRAYVPPPEKP